MLIANLHCPKANLPPSDALKLNLELGLYLLRRSTGDRASAAIRCHSATRSQQTLSLWRSCRQDAELVANGCWTMEACDA